MRGLLNQNIAEFISDNPIGFPPVPRYTGQVGKVEWINFDAAVTAKNSTSKGLHFFDSDYKLNRLWEYPQRYISVLRRFKYVVQPDFSLYYDFPVALQIYNKFRNHWLSAYFAVNGIQIIPNISLSTPNNFAWSIMGYPENSVVAFSDIGCSRDKEDKAVLMESYKEMTDKLHPSQVLYFTRSKTAPEGATVIHIPYRKDGRE